MKEIELKSKGAVSYSSAMKRLRLLSVAAVLLICCLVFVGAAGATDGVKVAKVGDTEYATIDEAITAWTTNENTETSLTLLADVTLSDVVQLKSTKHHKLNLGTYTMTAASGKNAFEIIAHGTGNAERSALTINADATNPGGINAGTKSIVYYDYSKGGITKEDRPIIKIEGGKFRGSTSLFWAPAGIDFNGGDAARKAATVVIEGGTFDCSIYGKTKSKLVIKGGIFNEGVSSQGDSTAHRLISGGTFKSFGWMTADDDNTKFWVGNRMGVSDVGVYVNDAGYLVVGGSVITEAGDKFVAKTANYGGWSSYLKYSSAAKNGLYYTSLSEIFADNTKTTSDITLFVNDVDMTDISYKGSITLTEGQTLTLEYLEYLEGTTPAWNVLRNDGKELKGSTCVDNGIVTHTYVNDVKIIDFDTAGGNEIPQIEQTSGTTVIAPEYPTKEGYTFAWDREIPSTMPAEDLTITASWTANTSTVHFDANGGEGTMNDQPFTYDVEQSLTALNFTKVGHTFNGWNTAADGSGTEYTDAQLVKNLTTENDGVVPLYAQWTANTYTVKFDANDGEGTMADQSFTYDDESKPLTANAFTRDGYTFNGWNTVSSGSGIAYSDKQNVRNLTAVNGGTVTLYAQWKENPQTPVVTPDDNKPNRVPITTTPKTTYKVTFYPNGGSGEMNAVTFVEGEQKAIPVNTFTREGYTFKGWALTPGGEVFYTDGEPVLIDGATSLYAVWEEVSLEKPEEPTDDPSDKPTEPTSPAPLFAVLAGLVAAVVLRRR